MSNPLANGAIRVRGIRTSLPSGYVVGRASGGVGPAELIPMSSRPRSAFVKAGTGVTVAGGAVSIIARASSNKTIATPGSITSTTAPLMMGLAGSITPAVGTAVFVTICGSIANSTLADGGTVQISYGTGTAPAGSAALTGTQIGSVQKSSAAVAANTQGFSVSAVIAGLTAGTAYWLDLAVEALTGGSVTLTQVNIAAHEI